MELTFRFFGTASKESFGKLIDSLGKEGFAGDGNSFHYLERYSCLFFEEDAKDIPEEYYFEEYPSSIMDFSLANKDITIVVFRTNDPRNDRPTIIITNGKISYALMDYTGKTYIPCRDIKSCLESNKTNEEKIQELSEIAKTSALINQQPQPLW